MFTTIRKHQRWLMLVIAVLTIIAFAFLYNTTDMDRVGSNIVAKIYDRDVMQVDVEKAVRNYQLALALGQYDLVRGLAGQAQTEDEAANNFIWNLMVLQHEAAALGVEPAEQAVVDRIKTLSVFQTNGQFDTVKYSAFLQEQLAPRGFTERQLESVMRDSLRLEELKQLVESPAVVLPGDLAPGLERLRPIDLQVVRFPASEFLESIKVSDEELQAVYHERQSVLQAPEKRSVRYVAFELTSDQAELKDRARIDALQQVATATGNFIEALTESDQPLVEVAKAKGFQVGTTPFFAANGASGKSLTGIEKSVVPAAARIAFRLPSGVGNYEVVQLGEAGYAVIEVAEIAAGRPLTLEEAQADLRADIITQKRDAAVRQAAEVALTGLRAKMSEGATFAAAAQAQKLKTEEIKGLSVFSPEATPEMRQVLMAAADLPAGTLSPFTPSSSGGFFVYLEARQEADDATMAERLPQLTQRVLQQEKLLLFLQWMVTAREASDLKVLRPAM